MKKIFLFCCICCTLFSTLHAHPVKASGKKRARTHSYMEVCANSGAQIDQDINNVRARLLGGGDFWWSFREGAYIAPKPREGEQGVSAFSGGSIWIGGFDQGLNMKMAAQSNRQGQSAATEFWPGPLDESGITDRTVCKKWDRHFRVTKDEILLHLKQIAAGNKNPADIPSGVKRWPARGNPYFEEIFGFSLPDRGLANFFDNNEDERYNPLDGDYPALYLQGAPNLATPDEMIFWVYNDEGGGAPHLLSQGAAIGMEVQATAFSFRTNDAFNEMTFQRHKFINRGEDNLDSLFFAIWTDPDLGCPFDDYVGCSIGPEVSTPARQMMYMYNADADDGTNCTCTGTPVYCKDIPLAGLSLLNLLHDNNQRKDIGMSSFMYINTNPLAPPGTHFPANSLQYYRYMTGSWADGAPLTYGGIGKGGTKRTRYAFPDPPNDPNGWSMVTAQMPPSDYQTLQSYGLFTMYPGQSYEMVFGVPFVASQQHPKPDMEPLFAADRLARVTFNEYLDAHLFLPPEVNWIEMDREVVAVLDGKNPEQTKVQDFLAPEYLTDTERKYLFEGYVVYQLIHPDVKPEEYDDSDKARIVAVSDIQNNVSKLYNWEAFRDETTQKLVYRPVEQVAGEDAGVRHTFRITEDKFAKGNANELVNHKRYYYAVIAYAYNNYKTFNPATGQGQKNTFIRSNAGIEVYTVIPRPVLDRHLQASYGEQTSIVRLEGMGSGWKNFLDLTDESRDQLFSPGLKDTILTYQPGYGPISVQIFNPFEVTDGQYELKFTDSVPDDTRLDAGTRWQLRRLPDGPVIVSAATIREVNEQIINEYGFSILAAHAQEPGNRSDPNNGFIGAKVVYKNPAAPWLRHYASSDFPPFNYLLVSNGERDRDIDPNKTVERFHKDGFFMPYALYDWHIQSLVNSSGNRLYTAAWTEGAGYSQGTLNATATGAVVDTNGVINFSRDRRLQRLPTLPNVDIVLTNDKSRWSRCIIVETASLYYTNSGNDPRINLQFPKDTSLKTERGPNNRPRLMFDTRPGLSVGKQDDDNDGLPDPDHATAPPGAPDAGSPLRGMGWFPGYAIDVETGQRLNIFFGENSCYHKGLDPAYTGRDMLWNPTAQSFRTPVLSPDYYDFVGGGQHWIYVATTPYDACEAIRRRLTPELNGSLPAAKVTAIRDIAWAGMVHLAPDARLLSLSAGLIPQETIFKLRVGRRYQTGWNDNSTPIRKNGMPRYQFSIQNRMSLSTSAEERAKALDSVQVVPNPYYAFSAYEAEANQSIVKITNLPPECTISIYTWSGQFVRQFEHREMYSTYGQIAPHLEWDMKNQAGKTIAGGLYLIHVQVPGIGERTLKWMGVLRSTKE